MECVYIEPTLGIYLDQTMMKAQALTPGKCILRKEVWGEKVMLKFISLIQSDPKLKKLFTHCYSCLLYTSGLCRGKVGGGACRK